MKLFNQSIAAGVTLALASVAAHAQLTGPVSINEGSAPGSQGLYLAVFNASVGTTEVVNLGLNYQQITTASGSLTPTASNLAFASATNPTGAGGSVLQLNFGQVAGFTAAGGNIFGGSSVASDSYMVLGAYTGSGGGMEVTDASLPIATPSALNTAQGRINSEIASWVSAAPTTGDLIDTTGSATFSVTCATCQLSDGQVLAGTNYSQTVGQAVGFYDVVSTGRSTDTINQYKNANGAGFWFLSSTGDLTYNIASGGAPVPLPAAIWLLGSGLLGMAGIARRRAAG